MERFFEQNYKKLGLVEIDAASLDSINGQRYKSYIKVLYLPAGYSLTVDFKRWTTKKSTLFFINSNQYCQVEGAGTAKGYFIYYNRDFYCVQIHDEEVACDGLLFNNIYGMPMTVLPAREDKIVAGAVQNILDELSRQESSYEEMIRTYLKQMIILATRVWKQQQLAGFDQHPSEDAEFFRTFSRLVEIHFREKHSVTDYAELLSVAPKTLSKRLNRLGVPQPNDVIKDRILLEAKRLLIYSPLSIKEIAYDLGYDDPAYFNRLFTSKVGRTPAAFKKQTFTQEQ
ncbi:helix-turn-helix domain-containing protein [Puia dinghuensis]|uniref:AraC family transcriptional regulator n=1 Tax=Puia dinghuensis TaxID=1792502 RepID=A0A8J2XTR5_9BACT|nr:AraC family transcriptional regulator [Puia dinghuensis]GGB01376.1 AraC family transcriptional regulator [Puia dinghuensis]